MQTSRPINSPLHRFAGVPFRSRRRGTVILLVVAVLALLAVIGTIYIVSARTQKFNAQSMEAAYNLQLARDAIMQQTSQIIGNSLLDSTGAIGGYNTSGTGGAISHNYDYPDGGETWLAATLHSQTSPPSTYSQLTPQLFDPATGAYDLPIQAAYAVNVVGDQTTNTIDPYNATTNPDGMPTTALEPDAYYNLLPFSDASGIRYRYALRIIDTNRMANLNTGATDDSAAVSDTFGTWLDSMRLAPTTSWLSPAPADYYNPNPTAPATADIPLSLHVSPNGNLGRASPLSGMGNATFSLANWQTQLLRFEKPTDFTIAPFGLADELELRTFGEYGTAYQVRASVYKNLANTVWPTTLSSDPAAPGTTNVTGNPSRRNYTNYSWLMDLRPFPDPVNKDIYTLSTAGGLPSGTPSTIWPIDPARISVNPLTPASATTSQDLMYYTAMAATNIATLMEFSTGSTNSDGTANTNFSGSQKSFTHEEACAFAANYCTAKWNGFTPDTTLTSPPAGGAYYLPEGPSFVDSIGICIRTALTSGGTTTTYHREFGVTAGADTDLHAETGTTTGKVYLGYSAQPYFSEVAASMIEDDSKGTPGIVSAANTAIELYNPYNKALSLKGYQITRGDGSGAIDLSGNYIPANGYFVILGSAGHYTIPGAATSYQTNSLQANVTGDTKYILYRPYVKRDLSTGFAPVDQIDYSSLVAPNAVAPAVQVGDLLPVASATVTAPVDFSIGRSGGPWGPTMAASLSPRSKTALTLGSANAVIAGVTGYPLPDRYCPTVSSVPNQGDVFGMGEFARITRIANEFDGTKANGALIAYTAGKDGGLVADHIAQLPTSGAVAPYSTMVLNAPGSATDSVDAQILFDFYADPATYSTAAQPTDTTGLHDIRASRLLSQIAIIDRYSEFNIDIGGGATDLNKIRLPGRINVNTANPDVLRAIPNMTDKMVANIVAYRSRAKTYSYNGTASSDFSDNTKYPGSGIRSVGELVVPLADATAATIDQRDLLWGPICNLCTVRSDTFVVYGYLEAVKQNPNYTGTFDNAAMWYTAPSGNGANGIDSSKNGGPIVRVARRRFLAIVDRSFCDQNKYQVDPATGLPTSAVNSKFILPKIVAIKDLPDVPGAP